MSVFKYGTSTAEFAKGDHVFYVPPHAVWAGPTHKDAERGVVAQSTEGGVFVFINFGSSDRPMIRACSPENVIKAQ